MGKISGVIQRNMSFSLHCHQPAIEWITLWGIKNISKALVSISLPRIIGATDSLLRVWASIPAKVKFTFSPIFSSTYEKYFSSISIFNIAEQARAC